MLEGGPDGQVFNLDDVNYMIMAFMLSAARLQAFFYASPIFSRKALPRVVRLGMIMALTIIMAPANFENLLTQDNITKVFLGLVLKELMIGFFLGFLIWMPIRGLEMAGVLIDTQRGSTQAQDYDVIFNATTTPTAIMLSQIFSGYFFAAGGFLMVLMVMFNSIDVWPPTEPLPPFADQAAFIYIKFAGVLYFTAVAVVMPISGFMVFADIVIAFIARSAPTLNALTFGMPVKSAIALIMLLFYMDIAYPMIFETFSEALGAIDEVFEQ